MSHLFEFMDLTQAPQGLRHTLRDILECGNGAPFRNYYSWVAQTAAQIAREKKLTTIVELGCGTAPITRHLVREASLPAEVKLVPCDLNPDVPVLTELQSSHGSRVSPIFAPVDFSVPRVWPANTLLLLSATFHHIPPAQRLTVLRALTESGAEVAIFEPLRNTLASQLFVFGSLVPAMLTPLRFFGRAGTLRRMFWCWLLPVAPPCFVWDGLVSCWRQWTERHWRDAQAALGDHSELATSTSLFCSVTQWSSKKSNKPAEQSRSPGLLTISDR